MYCHWKSWVDWITPRWEKMSQSQKCTVHFEKKCQKKQKQKKKNIFPLMAAFYNSTLKIETSWVKKVVKAILKTWNTNVCSVYSFSDKK